MAGTTETLSAELAKSVPRWNWLTTSAGQALVYVVAWSAILIPAVVWLPVLRGANFLAVTFFGVVFALFLLAILEKRIVRQFELLEPGATATTTRHIRSVGGVFAFVASAVGIIGFLMGR